MTKSYTTDMKVLHTNHQGGRRRKDEELYLQCFVFLNKERLYLNNKYILYKYGKMLAPFNFGDGHMWVFYITFGEGTVFVCLKQFLIFKNAKDYSSCRVGKRLENQSGEQLTDCNSQYI